MLTVPTTPLELETRLQDHALNEAILVHVLSEMPKSEVQPFLAKALKGAPFAKMLKHVLWTEARRLRRERERRAAHAEALT